MNYKPTLYIDGSSVAFGAELKIGNFIAELKEHNGEAQLPENREFCFGNVLARRHHLDYLNYSTCGSSIVAVTNKLVQWVFRRPHAAKSTHFIIQLPSFNRITLPLKRGFQLSGQEYTVGRGHSAEVLDRRMTVIDDFFCADTAKEFYVCELLKLLSFSKLHNLKIVFFHNYLDVIRWSETNQRYKFELKSQNTKADLVARCNESKVFFDGFKDNRIISSSCMVWPGVEFEKVTDFYHYDKSTHIYFADALQEKLESLYGKIPQR